MKPTPSPMRIAIDYTTGIYPGAGIARYTRSLVGALAEIDRDNQYALFYASRGLPRPTPESEQADALFREHPNFRGVPVPKSYSCLGGHELLRKRLGDLVCREQSATQSRCRT